MRHHPGTLERAVPNGEDDVTAQPLSEMEPLPAWAIPPEEGFTADDLDRPEIPRHTELIDGTLVLVGPQTSFHTTTMDLLVHGLRQTIPRDMLIRREMTVTLGRRQRPEPDLVVVHASSLRDSGQTTFRPADVLLAVEVMSRESEVRDRERKPQLYADAGIPHFWRVEKVGEGATVYVYELDPATRTYLPTGIHHGRLKVAVPYAIDIDLTELGGF